MVTPPSPPIYGPKEGHTRGKQNYLKTPSKSGSGYNLQDGDPNQEQDPGSVESLVLVEPSCRDPLGFPLQQVDLFYQARVCSVRITET